MNHQQQTDKQPGVLSGWWADESGVTAIEYGLLASLIVIVSIGAFTAFSDALAVIYKEWTDAVLAAL